jgi:AcrR family transcriptional regulator
MSDVALESAPSLGGLYRYFDCKEDLFDALMGDVHAELFTASGGTGIDLATNPYAELLEANRRFFSHYVANRGILRAFVEASTVEPRFQLAWGAMRERHIDRFMHVYVTCPARYPRELAVMRKTVESLTCMMDQCAYVWFAHAAEDSTPDLEQSARIATDVWYRALFIV